MTEHPNIVFLMPDQLRHDFLGCYGAKFIDTPNIDALCSPGVRYTSAYSGHPVCVPARASLLTGMNAIKTGVLDNGSYLRPDYRQCGLNTWPELLAEHGYTTLATGKMHFYPWEARFGFQRRIIAEDKLWGFIQDDYYHFLQARGYSKTSFVNESSYHENHMALTSPLPWDANCDHWVGEQTAQWIESYEGDRPFAVMVGFPGPHSPYDPALEYADSNPVDMPDPIVAVEHDTAMLSTHFRSDPKADGLPGSRRPSWYAVDNPNPPTIDTYRYIRACYVGLVRQIDLEVGRVVQALECSGRLDNTIIIFSSDHGDYLGDHGLVGKGTFYEGSCHIPMIVRHPQAVAGVVRDDLVTLTDVTATILALAGVSLPSYMDAQPLPGLGMSCANPDHVFGYLSNGAMIFDGRWKYVRYPGGIHLFDIRSDPQEQYNHVSDASCADIVQRLDSQLWAEIGRSIGEANFTNRVYSFSYSGSQDFGRTGWERTYPMRWDRIYDS